MSQQLVMVQQQLDELKSLVKDQALRR